MLIGSQKVVYFKPEKSPEILNGMFYLLKIEFVNTNKLFFVFRFSSI